MLTNKNEFVKLHRQMWTSIADYIHDAKRVVNINGGEVIWLRKRWFPYHKSIPSSGCFACEYRGYNRSCEEGCLFNWSNDEKFVTCFNGLYKECKDSADWFVQEKLAREIANLPVREEV